MEKPQSVYITSDNITTVAALNKGTSRCKGVMQALRLLFWLSAIFNFHIKALHISGSLHCMADSISRLGEPIHWDNFHRLHNVLLRQYDFEDYLHHMSEASLFHCLQVHSAVIGEQSCKR